MIKQNNLRILLICLVFFLFISLLVIESYSRKNPKQSVEIIGRSKLEVNPTCAYFYFDLNNSQNKESEQNKKDLNLYSELALVLKEDGLKETSILEIKSRNNLEEKNNLILEIPLTNNETIINIFNSELPEEIVLEKVIFDICHSEKNTYESHLITLASKDAKEKSQILAKGISNNIGKLLNINLRSINFSPILVYDFTRKNNQALEFYLDEENKIFQEISTEVSCLYELI